MSVHTIEDSGDIEQLRETIAGATTNAAKAIASLAGLVPIQILVRMKFHELGYHPLEDRRLNLIQQVNQTFTYLVSLAAAEYILKRHPGSGPISLNLGTTSGSDLESASQSVAARDLRVSPADQQPQARQGRREGGEVQRSAQIRVLLLSWRGLHAVSD